MKMKIGSNEEIIKTKTKINVLSVKTMKNNTEFY